MEMNVSNNEEQVVAKKFHGAGRSTDQVIGENADLLSFALYEMIK